MWTLDLDRFLWSKPAITGPAPPESEDHVAIFDPVGYRMIIHGGENGLDCFIGVQRHQEDIGAGLHGANRGFTDRKQL